MERTLQPLEVGDVTPTDAMHHEVAVALEHAHHRLDARGDAQLGAHRGRQQAHQRGGRHPRPAAGGARAGVGEPAQQLALEKLAHQLAEVVAEPGMGFELPRMGELVEDQPAAQ